VTALVIAIISGLLLLMGTALTALVNYMMQDRKDLRERMDRVESKLFLSLDYILALRNHIERGDPPPPPPYPQGFTNHG
jgi:sensor domain CHASE-containing protein